MLFHGYRTAANVLVSIILVLVALKPIQPIRVFEAADIEPAVQTMQKEQHIGKLVVRNLEDASAIAASRAPQRLSLHADISYLLVGGLGGLGRSIALWMGENGANNSIFVSRSGSKKPHEITLIRALRGSGCTVDVRHGQCHRTR